MTIALIVGGSEERLWGLTGQERVARQLRQLGNIGLAQDVESIPATERVLVLRADYAYDLPTLTGLAGREGLLMDGTVPAAAHVERALAPAALALLRAADPGEAAPASIPAIHTGDLDSFEADLRKTEAPLLEPIAAGTIRALENRLYGVSYKGITDFITKWWWPVPAKAMVRLCARSGISPNAVTCTGFALMLATCWLFGERLYFWGLALGWFMTFLDTVDGKLARVTVQSSRFGHWLDHGMDIAHPPFWYWLWGLSLTGFEPRLGFGLEALMIFIAVGYAGGRLIEGAFHGLGSVSLFAWRPFDAWFRLFTARRNPCLLLLTAGWLVNEPGLGFELVAWWTLVSAVVILGRLALACCVRVTSGPLTSWLSRDEAPRKHPRSFRTFSSTRRAYG